MNITKQVRGIVAAAAALGLSTTATAQTSTYPVQEFRMGIGGTTRNIAISGTASGAVLGSATRTGGRGEKWSLNFVSSGVYEIVNSQTGYVVTNQNGIAVIAPDADAANQRWKIVSVAKDFEGFDLYYKIVSNASADLALTLDTASNTVTVAAYTGGEFQKHKLNLDGLEGYGANSQVGGKEKAGTIGGLLGATEFVSTVAQLVAALNKPEPLTVVVTADLDLVNQGKDQQRIRDNKTLVGSYAKNTIYDCQLRNDDFNGADAAPSNNIVVRNLNLVARTLNANGSGVILLFVYGGRNIWIDHNDFSATFAQNKDLEVGKFIWINTPVANWSDGVYNGVNPDYITISYNAFKNRYWTVAFGSQNKDVSRLRSTVMFNRWEQCSRRTPQYSNGYLHVYSSFHTVTGSSNANASSQVIAGEGSRVLSENMRFEAHTGKEIDIDRSLALSYHDNNSYTASTTTATPSRISVTALGTAWKASDSYGYSLVAGYLASGKDAKAFTNAYSGCFKSYAEIKYVTDSDLSSYVSWSCVSPFLKTIAVGSGPVGGGKVGAVLDTLRKYTIRNVNSGLYLAPAEGVPADGTDVLQGSAGRAWTLSDAGDGYYRLYADVDGGKTWLLDVEGAATSNGTGIDIRTLAAGDGQSFKFVADSSGSYGLTTKVSADAGCVGVVAGSKDAGALAVEWACNGSDDQRWIVKPRIDTLEGTLIRRLVIHDTDNYLDWKIASGAQVGGLVFGDRTMTWTALPTELLGAEAVRTAADSKNSAADLATFVAGTDITAYVALDERVATVPAWLGSWTKTSLIATNSTDVRFVLYRREIDSGATVALGQNGQVANCVNYAVFATRAVSVGIGSKVPRGTVVARLERDRLVVVNGAEGSARVSVHGLDGGMVAEFRIEGRGTHCLALGRNLSRGVHALRIESAAGIASSLATVE